MPYIHDILAANDKLMQKATSIQGLLSGTVRIGTLSSICVNWIPNIIKSFKVKFPNISVEVLQEDSYEYITNQVRTGVIDIGFVSLSSFETLFTTPLHRDKLLFLASNDFKPIHEGYVTKEDLTDKNIIFQRKGADSDTKMLLKKFGLTLYPQYIIEDDGSIVTLVENGF